MRPNDPLIRTEGICGVFFRSIWLDAIIVQIRAFYGTQVDRWLADTSSDDPVGPFAGPPGVSEVRP